MVLMEDFVLSLNKKKSNFPTFNCPKYYNIL